MDDKMRDAIWLVEYSPISEAYRISRFAEPAQSVAYVEYWSDAVSDIRCNYGNAVKVILVRKADGTVDYWHDVNEEVFL